VAQFHHAELRPPDYVAEHGRWSLSGIFDWREWDGEFVVRVEGTASTYMLSTLTGETLMALRDGAAYVDEIATRVFEDCTAPNPATAALVARFAVACPETQSLLAALATLEALGLATAELT